MKNILLLLTMLFLFACEYMPGSGPEIVGGQAIDSEECVGISADYFDWGCTNMLKCNIAKGAKYYQKKCSNKWASIKQRRAKANKDAIEFNKQYKKQKEERIKQAQIDECIDYGFTPGTDGMGQCMLKLKEIEILKESHANLASEIEKEKQRQQMMYLSQSLLNMGSALSNSGQSSTSNSSNTATFTKVCIKEGLGGLESLTVSSTALCPLGYEEYY